MFSQFYLPTPSSRGAALVHERPTSLVYRTQPKTKWKLRRITTHYTSSVWRLSSSTYPRNAPNCPWCAHEITSHFDCQGCKTDPAKMSQEHETILSTTSSCCNADITPCNIPTKNRMPLQVLKSSKVVHCSGQETVESSTKVRSFYFMIRKVTKGRSMRLLSWEPETGNLWTSNWRWSRLHRVFPSWVPGCSKNFAADGNENENKDRIGVKNECHSIKQCIPRLLLTLRVTGFMIVIESLVLHNQCPAAFSTQPVVRRKNIRQEICKL